jgi:hypothetical protein
MLAGTVVPWCHPHLTGFLRALRGSVRRPRHQVSHRTHVISVRSMHALITDVSFFSAVPLYVYVVRM